MTSDEIQIQSLEAVTRSQIKAEATATGYRLTIIRGDFGIVLNVSRYLLYNSFEYLASNVKIMLDAKIAITDRH